MKKLVNKKLWMFMGSVSLPFLCIIPTLSASFPSKPNNYEDENGIKWSDVNKNYSFEKDPVNGDGLALFRNNLFSASFNSVYELNKKTYNNENLIDENYYASYNDGKQLHNGAEIVESRENVMSNSANELKFVDTLEIEYSIIGRSKKLLEKFLEDEFIQFKNGKRLILYKNTIREIKEMLKNVSVDYFNVRFKWKAPFLKRYRYKENIQQYSSIHKLDWSIVETYTKYYDTSFSASDYDKWYDMKNIEFNFFGSYGEKYLSKDKTAARKYFDKLQSAIKSKLLNSNGELELSTDTGGDLTTSLQKLNNSLKTNYEYLNEKIKDFYETFKQENKELLYEANKIFNFNDLKFEIVDRQKNIFNLSNGREYYATNINIRFIPTDYYNGLDTLSKLKLKLGKWVDFESGTTNLVDDVAVLDKTDKRQIGQNGKTFYGGRWIVHSPAEIEFRTTKNENEVLFVNGKRVDVINGEFRELLVDKRTNANDNERELNSNVVKDENTIANENNSHFKNEYKIQIFKYKNGSNLESELEMVYEKVFVINSRSQQEQFKWYAWNPANNKHQQELIEEYLKDNEGNILYDKNNNPIPNPKYDPAIDPATGTKKELVLIDFAKSKFNFSGIEYSYSKIEDRLYAKDTNLPYKTKFLFAPHSNAKGKDYQKVLAEATVLGKGGLKKLLGKTQNFTLFKLNEETFTFEKVDDKYYRELDTKTGESSYFSYEGTWLFCSNAKQGITNFKLVKIVKGAYDENGRLVNSGKFFSELVKYNDNEILPLWKSELGVKFMFWMKEHKQKKVEDIYKLNYEDTLEFYKEYVNYLYANQKVNYVIKPSFVGLDDNVYTLEEFKNLFAIDLIRNNNNQPLTDEQKRKNDEKINSKENKQKIKRFILKHLGDFNFKNYFEIEYIQISDRKDGIYIKWKISSLDVAFNQKVEKIFVGFKFKDIDYNKDPNDPTKPAKKNIHLEVDDEYINELAKTHNKDEWFKTLEQNKRKLFKNISDEDFKKLYVKLKYEEQNKEKLLTVEVSLLKPYWKEYQIIPRSRFRVNINQFLEKQNNDNNGENNNGNNNSTTDIFEYFLLKELNLSGLTNEKEIRDFIIDKIKEASNKLELDKDFIIKNIETVIAERKNVEELENKDLATFTNLVLEAKGEKVGYRKIKVYNFVRKNILAPFDLSKIKVSDLEINESDFNKIREIIIKKVNEVFREQNFLFDKEYLIENLEIGVNRLGLGKGATFTFKIVGKHKKLINSTSFTVKNIADKVVIPNNPNIPGSKEEKVLFDLSLISISNLAYKEYKMSELRNKILQAIWKEMKLKYDLSYKVHYDIDINALNSLIRNISQKSNNELKGDLFLLPIKNVSKNQGIVKISNWNKDYKAIDDIEDNKDLPEYNENEIKKNNHDKQSNNIFKKLTKKQAMYIFIPLGVISAGVLGLLGWFIYIRKFNKKVK